MASRYTFSDLEKDILHTNLYLAQSGSNTIFQISGAYGYTEMWVGCVNDIGVRDIHSRIESGSPRDCLAAMRAAAKNQYGKITDIRRGSPKPTRLMALGVMNGFMNMSEPGDSDALSVDLCIVLSEWAKKAKYFAPKNASGSRVRYFFYNLQKLAAKTSAQKA